jgi:hypothetical protein
VTMGMLGATITSQLRGMSRVPISLMFYLLHSEDLITD